MRLHRNNALHPFIDTDLFVVFWLAADRDHVFRAGLRRACLDAAAWRVFSRSIPGGASGCSRWPVAGRAIDRPAHNAERAKTPIAPGYAQIGGSASTEGRRGGKKS